MNSGENNTNINTSTNAGGTTATNTNGNQNVQNMPPLGVTGSAVNTNVSTSNTNSIPVSDGNTLNSTTNVPMTGTSPIGGTISSDQSTVSVSMNEGLESGNQTLSTNNTDSSVIVNEKLKEVEINYTPPSKFKTFMTVMLFILFIAFVIFLPDITSMISQYKLNKNRAPETVITTGQLECSLKSNTSNLDMEYLRTFKFTDSKLYEANYTLTTKGDATLDEKTLDTMAEKCNDLADNTKDLAGVSISCNYSDGKLVERQNYIFASIIYKNLDAAFTEAGGTYPEFSDGQEIDSVEKTMNAAGYSCSRKEQ